MSTTKEALSTFTANIHAAYAQANQGAGLLCNVQDIKHSTAHINLVGKDAEQVAQLMRTGLQALRGPESERTVQVFVGSDRNSREVNVSLPHDASASETFTTQVGALADRYAPGTEGFKALVKTFEAARKVATPNRDIMPNGLPIGVQPEFAPSRIQDGALLVPVLHVSSNTPAFLDAVAKGADATMTVAPKPENKKSWQDANGYTRFGGSDIYYEAPEKAVADITDNARTLTHSVSVAR